MAFSARLILSSGLETRFKNLKNILVLLHMNTTKIQKKYFAQQSYK